MYDNWRRCVLKDDTRTKIVISPTERLVNLDTLKKSVAKLELSLTESYREIDITQRNTKSIIDKLKQKIARNEIALENIIQKMHEEKDFVVPIKCYNIFWISIIVFISLTSFLIWYYWPTDLGNTFQFLLELYS